MKPFPGDDLLHAPDPAQWWNESFYFNFFDTKARAEGASSVSASVRRPA
jgi:hypothetical protein